MAQRIEVKLTASRRICPSGSRIFEWQTKCEPGQTHKLPVSSWKHAAWSARWCVASAEEKKPTNSPCRASERGMPTRREKLCFLP
eukprot:4231337-Prorocentrum_lima.AAC.1